MNFKNYKNKMERPFIVFADTECSLVPTGLDDKVAFRQPNSACFYFHCTFDDSRSCFKRICW